MTLFVCVSDLTVIISKPVDRFWSCLHHFNDKSTLCPMLNKYKNRRKYTYMYASTDIQSGSSAGQVHVHRHSVGFSCQTGRNGPESAQMLLHGNWSMPSIYHLKRKDCLVRVRNQTRTHSLSLSLSLSLPPPPSLSPSLSLSPPLSLSLLLSLPPPLSPALWQIYPTTNICTQTTLV